MKKIKLLMPLLGLTATAGLVLPAAVSCGNGQQETTYKVSLSSDSEGIEPIDVTEIKEKTELVVTLKFKTGYKAFVATPTATVGGSAVASTFKETATGGTLTIAADLITGDVVITAIATDESVAGIVNNTVEYDLADSGIKSVNCDKTIITQDDLEADYVVMNFSITNSDYMLAFGLDPDGHDIALSFGEEDPAYLNLYDPQSGNGDYAFRHTDAQTISVLIYGSEAVTEVFQAAAEAGQTVNVDFIFGINKLQYGLHFIDSEDYKTPVSIIDKVEVFDLYNGVDAPILINEFKGADVANAYVDAETVLDEYGVVIHYDGSAHTLIPSYSDISYGPEIYTGLGTLLYEGFDFQYTMSEGSTTDETISFRFNPYELMLIDMYFYFIVDPA